jgi:hypothetical protein
MRRGFLTALLFTSISILFSDVILFVFIMLAGHP